ncbi:tyrosine-type recombinase/integrase [Dechloromonas sp. TW-R-39-2]|uniref:tyrosine-type recombinase/integrase n=1 Tax=Dechloromonas sp. TW-R-39-2 TaxID=2654218 RepID=UPI00193DB129|nr:integrase family protein [Dechloromonas sp. TW-R-39-2]QRM19716.1 tyrosine-type recombinase/integrase [Dechloromonas sp. TW-R-39-2]
MKLTETALRALKAPEKHELLSDDATQGLYLKLYTSGRKSWLFRTRKGGAWRVVTLGQWPTMALAQARQKALEMSGNDIPEAMTFGALLDRWYDLRIEPRYKVTANIQTYVAKGKQWLGHTQLVRLTTSAMVSKLQEYAESAPVSANRCLSNWKLALDYACEIGALDNNPLARTTSRVVGGEEKTRDRTLSDSEIRTVWNSGETIMRFLLLTGLRISEAQKGTQEQDKWHLDSTKNGDPHWVHLTPLASSQIEPWTTSPTSIQSKLKRWCEREKVQPFTPHDLRRTFATRLAGIGIAPHVIEKCLNHRMQGVMAVYNRHDYAAERIAAAEQWSTELERILAGSGS